MPLTDKWYWKPVFSEEPHSGAGLLYEPGNWGDILKGSWALIVTRFLLSAPNQNRFRFLDPFAGAPTYAISPSAAARCKALPETVFREAQDPFLARGVLGSTGSVVMALCESMSVEVDFRVFDQDFARRSQWLSVPGVEVLDGLLGEDAFVRSLEGDWAPDLALLDPYDLFDRWGAFLQPALQAAQRFPVLLYMYNKSPRGKSYLDQYIRFRRKLEQAEGLGLEALLGRVPGDQRLPRAFHEMVLLGTPSVIAAVQDKLETMTRSLASRIAESGAFERLI